MKLSASACSPRSHACREHALPGCGCERLTLAVPDNSVTGQDTLSRARARLDHGPLGAAGPRAALADGDARPRRPRRMLVPARRGAAAPAAAVPGPAARAPAKGATARHAAAVLRARVAPAIGGGARGAWWPRVGPGAGDRRASPAVCSGRVRAFGHGARVGRRPAAAGAKRWPLRWRRQRGGGGRRRARHGRQRVLHMRWLCPRLRRRRLRQRLHHRARAGAAGVRAACAYEAHVTTSGPAHAARRGAGPPQAHVCQCHRTCSLPWRDVADELQMPGCTDCRGEAQVQGGGRAAPASRDAAPTVPLLSMDMAESAVRSLRPVAGRRGGVAGSIAAPAAAASTLATEPAAGTPGRSKRSLGARAQARRAGRPVASH
jgi:hypothetical protein